VDRLEEGGITLLSISYAFYKRFTHLAIALLVFAAGVAGSALNALLTLRIAFGSLVILAFLRYPYALLLGWVLINAFIGSSIPVLSGNNLLSGLTIPTILLLFCLPTKQAFGHMRALPLLLCYVLWVLLSIGISPIPMSDFVVAWTLRLTYVAIGVLTIYAITTRQRLLRLIDATLLVAVVIALYGLYGYFTRQNGIVDPQTGFFRIGSLFGTPPTLAIFLSIIIPLALYRTLTLPGLKRLIGIAVISLLLVTLGLTYSRGPLMFVPISILVMVIFLPSWKLKAVVFSSLAIALLLAINTSIVTRFLNQDLSTLNGRTYLWQAVLDHFDPAQLLGKGLQSSDLLLVNLRVGVGQGIIATATHNIFLEVLYEQGLIGLTLLALAFAVLLVTLLNRWRKATVEHRMIIATALGIFCSVLGQSLESNDIWNQAIGIYFWIAVALPFALCWFQQSSKPET
jgi:O-antigen ligase